MKQFRNIYAHLILPLAVIALSGCGSLKKDSSVSFASVVIANRSVAEIQQAAKAVFEDAGYFSFIHSDGEMVFEKEGTRGAQIAHGGWMDDSPVAVRVHAETVALRDGAQRLQCKAYIVRDSHSSLYEEEKRIPNFRSGPYQKLLDEVAKRLK